MHMFSLHCGVWDPIRLLQDTFGKAPSFSRPDHLQNIAIVGERASGTFFVQKMMSQNFAQKVHHKLTRHKHWFQREVPASELQQTLVVVVFRNAWDWVSGLRSKAFSSLICASALLFDCVAVIGIADCCEPCRHNFPKRNIDTDTLLCTGNQCRTMFEHWLWTCR